MYRKSYEISICWYENSKIFFSLSLYVILLFGVIYLTVCMYFKFGDFIEEFYIILYYCFSGNCSRIVAFSFLNFTFVLFYKIFEILYYHFYTEKCWKNWKSKWYKSANTSSKWVFKMQFSYFANNQYEIIMHVQVYVCSWE